DAKTQLLELSAVKQLTPPTPVRETAPALQPLPSSPSQQGGVLLNDSSHSQNHLFRDALQGVHALDARHNRIPDLRSEQLGGHLAAVAGEQGLRRIDHVAMSEDASRTFAIEGRPQDPAHKRVGVDTVEGLNTSLAASTQRIDSAERQQAHTAAQAMTQQQEADTLARPALRLA
ncbi:MAG: XVIPCD domain-containing protein, partial [Pseudoxanthomonas sp.]